MAQRLCGDLSRSELVLFTRGRFDHPDGSWADLLASGGATIQADWFEFDEGFLRGKISLAEAVLGTRSQSFPGLDGVSF